MRPPHLVGLVLALTSIAACGGGGSDDVRTAPEGVADLWHSIGWTAEPAPIDSTSALYSRTTLVETGDVQFQIVGNNTGSVSPTPVLVDLRFRIEANDAFHLDDLAGTPAMAGGVGPDPRIGLLGTVQNGAPSMQAMIRASSSSSTGLLSGRYHFARFDRLIALASRRLFLGATRFDGLGGFADESGTIVNAGGALGASAPLTGAYAVALDGTLELSTGPHRGGVSADGVLAMAAGALTPGADPGIHVYLRAASEATNATLQGSYWCIGLRIDGTAPSSFTGDAVFDGVQDGQIEGGSMSIAGLQPTQFAVQFTVSPDGAIEALLDGAPVQGGVSADGDVAFLGGIAANTNTQLLLLFVRRLSAS